MMGNRGFFLVYELLCFGLCALLLAHAAQCLTACFRTQERSLQLQQAWQAAQLAAFEQELPAHLRATVEYKEQNGLRVMEVKVYDEEGDGALCSLVQSVP